MPTRDRAVYMREHRAKRKAEHATYDDSKPLVGQLKTRIGDLEEEVARLKRELAARPGARDPFREFRPVPKPK